MRKYNVVVAEDHEEISKIICDVVSGLGHNPIPFRTGQSVINYLTEKGLFGVEGYKTTALILSDLKMPDGTGMDILKVRNSLDSFLPIYLVSGVAKPEDTNFMASEKLSGYIPKDELYQTLPLVIKNSLATKIHTERPVVVWKFGGSADDYDYDSPDDRTILEGALVALYSFQVKGMQVVVTCGAGEQGKYYKKKLRKYGTRSEAIRKHHPERIMKCVDSFLSILEDIIGPESAVHIDGESMMRNYNKLDPYFYLNQNKMVLMGLAPRHLTICRSDLVDKDSKSYPNIPLEDSDSHTGLIAELVGAGYIGLLKRTDQIYKYDPYKDFEKGMPRWAEAQKDNKSLGPVSYEELLAGVTKQNDLISRVCDEDNAPKDVLGDHLFENSALGLLSKSDIVKRIGVAHISPFELYPDGKHIVMRAQVRPHCNENAFRKLQIYAVHDGTSKAQITK